VSKAERIDILIQALSDGEFHSGQSLGALMGVSRASVWKYIKALADIGIAFESIPGRGYRVVGGIHLLDKKAIMQSLNSKASQLFKEVFYFSEIDSTNQFLLDLSDSGKAIYSSVCIAERQTSGRGRRGRKWVSPFAKNIYCSVLLRFEKPLVELEGLSLVVGLSILKALEEMSYSDIYLKWPNDLLFQNKKLAGILLEVRGDLTDFCDVVIGFGLNVSMPPEFAKEIDQEWVDLKSISETLLDRNILIASILNHLALDVSEFEKKGFAGFRERWNKKDAYFSKNVTITAGKEKVEGVSKGVSESGALILAVGNEKRIFHGGEVSLRGQNAALD